MFLLDFLFPPRTGEAVLREVEAHAFITKLSPLLVPVTRPPSVALLPYQDPVVRAAIHEAKYHGSERAFSLLAAVLADFLPEYLSETRFNLGGKRSNLVSLVPVPLGATRRRERGYNQVEEIARRALPALRSFSEVGPSLTINTSLLLRTRETATQVSLERKAREENMRSAFTASLKLRSASTAAPDTLYIVLDDVLTTGATLAACLDALVAAGIPRDQLIPIALAH